MEGFYGKLIAVQGELKAPKGQYNSFGKYKYRSCEDILEAVKPLLVKNGLLITITDDIVMVGNRIYVKATVTVSDGTHSVSNSAFAREEETKKGMDGSQVTGASSSYARKYALNGMFCIDDTKDSDATNDGKGDDGADFKQMAVSDISRCSDLNALMSVWNNYTSLQRDKDFVDAMTAKKTAIKNGL